MCCPCPPVYPLVPSSFPLRRRASVAIVSVVLSSLSVSVCCLVSLFCSFFWGSPSAASPPFLPLVRPRCRRGRVRHWAGQRERMSMKPLAGETLPQTFPRIFGGLLPTWVRGLPSSARMTSRSVQEPGPVRRVVESTYSAGVCPDALNHLAPLEGGELSSGIASRPHALSVLL